jgi:hypothetical protein
VKKLMMPQRSPEWFKARCGVVTASELDALVTPLWKVRTGEGPAKYLALKLAEKWRGEPLAAWAASGAMEQGSTLEEESRRWVEFDLGVEIQTVGFITTDDGRLGCSPDGLIGDDCGAEIKCPLPQTHVAYLLAGGVPKDYAAQLQMAMYVTGFKRWMFVSYARRFPPLVLTVARDEDAMASIEAATTEFLERMDEGWARLIELNGGRLPERPALRIAAERFDPETGEVFEESHEDR